MAYDAVTVTQFRAKDGSLHGSRAATREKKIAFIKSFGHRALERAISEAVYRFGAENFLTDDQLDEITTEQVRDARRSAKLNRENRNRLASRERAA